MRKSIILYLTAVILFTLVLFRPFTFHLRDAVVNVVDPLFYAWNLSHNANNWFKGLDANLNTNIFYPLTNTIAYSDTLWGQSFFVNPIIWITRNPILAENIAVILSFPLSALSMFLLSMYFTGNKMTSFASGIFYAFSYPRLSQIGHLPAITNQWLPLYLLYLFKFLNEGKKRYFILLCTWYLLSLTSSIYFGVFLVPITAIVLIVDIVKRIKHNTLIAYKSKMLTVVPIIIPFIIILGISIFPYIRLKAEYPQIKRSIDDLTHLRAEPVDYISVLPTSLISFTKLPINVNEHVLYPTLTVIILAIVGIRRTLKKNKAIPWSFILICVASFVLSLGNEYAFSIGPYSTGTIKLPYYYLYTYVPIFQTVRVTARFSIFVILSLSMFSAWGIKEILVKNNSKWIVCLILSVFFFEVWQTNTPYVTVPLENSIPRVYEWIKIQPEPMILAEVPVSLFYHGRKMEDQLYLPYVSLREQDVYALETYRIYFSAFHHKRLLNGYSGFLPDSYNRLAETLESFPAENTLDTMKRIGITHVIVHMWQYDDKRKADIIQTLSASTRVSLVYSDNEDRVYIIQ